MTDTSFAQGKSPDKRVLIGFKGGTGRQLAQQRKDTIGKFGGEVHHSFHIIPVVSARLPEQAIAKLKEHPQIAYVEDDIIMHVIAQETPWGVNKIGAPSVWATSRGAGVHVAILDTGIDYDHPDLDDNIDGGVYFAGWIWDEISGKDGSTNPTDWNDGHGHGTHCAGIVAAEDNEIGVVGVAPEARLHAVKVLDDNGSGFTSDIIQGIEWCMDSSIDIASMSFGSIVGSASLQSACNAAYSAGVLLVGAAGNENGGAVIYPAAYASVIAVSATDDGDVIAGFSSIGPQVELAAPGVGIYSTVPQTGHPDIAHPSGYNHLSGTSMACPHVSGVAALLIASGIADVRTQLRITATDLGVPGKDDCYGFGRVDAARAVNGPEESGLSGWLWLEAGMDLGYSLDESDLVYFYSWELVMNYNITTGQWVDDTPTGWIYVDWPFYYILDSAQSIFALPPVGGLWVYHYSTEQWAVLPRVIPF